MIRIDEIYSTTFWAWLKTHSANTRMFYCDPFGRTDPDSVSNYGNNADTYDNYTFFFDQEPIDLARHADTFKLIKDNNADIEERAGAYTGHLVTSEKNSDSVKELCKLYNWQQHYYFFHGWAALDWYRGYNRSFEMPEPKDRTITKTFIAPNRIIAGQRQHRLQILYWIFKHGMANNWISCPEICPAENIGILDAVKPLADQYPDIEQVFSRQTFPMEFPGESGAPMHSCWLSLFDQCAESLLYLVTETVATGQRLHLTEKTFKPICLKMPFVLVGTQGSLAYLRSYGFKTFGDLWDESYDDEIDDRARIEKIAKLLKHLDSLEPDKKQQLFEQAQSIVQYNYEHFYNGGFEEILWKELNQMLLDLGQRKPQAGLGFDFFADTYIGSTVYPSLAQHRAYPGTEEWKQFNQVWPYTVPPELIEHCRIHGFTYRYQGEIHRLPHGTFYLIGVGFFDFNIDYFDLLRLNVKQALKRKELQLLFYYHEGDNPYQIQQYLDSLCKKHGYDVDCYKFISGNSVADNIKNFVYFPDHELRYWAHNRNQPQLPTHNNTRHKEFTVLSRTHKQWRATVMSHLRREGILENSYWSYGVVPNTDPRNDENPIQIDLIPNLKKDQADFLQSAPYTCDQLTSNQHNNHGITVAEHFTNSYCHIVLETYFDAGSSTGTFLSEKTFKPIKHGQPFLVVAPPGTLAVLRSLGYRTFDHAIDNSYDRELDNTQRWLKILDAVKQIRNNNMHDWFLSCQEDIQHNQRIFAESKYSRLNSLLNQLKK